MMLVSMRMQKSQVKTTSWRWSAGKSDTWRRSLYLMAGFTKFDCLVVGAAGGRSGTVHATSWGPNGTQDSHIIWYQGGGGGGAQRRRGYLKNLPNQVSCYAGKSGTFGPNVTVRDTYSTGGNGENSSFGDFISYGGKGGQTPKINYSVAQVAPVQLPSGGGSNANPSLVPPSTPGTNGVWQRVSGTAEGPEEVTAMTGGAGGYGRWSHYSEGTYYIDKNAQKGGVGGVGNFDYFGQGEAIKDNVKQFHGGGGGGADAYKFLNPGSLIDGDDQYGTGWYGAQGVSGGIVLLKVS